MKAKFVPARGLSITGLCVISIGNVGSTLVAVLVLGGPGLPGQTCGHPVDWKPGHHAALELDVLEGDHQEPGPGRGDCHKGGEDKDLGKIFSQPVGISIFQNIALTGDCLCCVHTLHCIGS